MSEFWAPGASRLVEFSLEDEWPRLRAQLDIDDTWLAFAFCSSREQSAELLLRSVRYLGESNRSIRRVQAFEPFMIDRVVELLTRSPAQRDLVTWVDGITPGESRRHAGRDAWERALLRANDHRDAIMRQQPGGLVFCLPVEFKPLVREAAPDLWAKRVLAVEVEPPASLVSREEPPSTTEREGPEAPLQVAEPLDTGNLRGTFGTELRKARNALDIDEVSSAIDLLKRIFEGSTSIAERAQAWHLMALVKEGMGDAPGAIAELEKAVASGGLTRGQLDQALTRLSRLADMDNRPELALAAIRALVSIRREGSPTRLASALSDLARRELIMGRPDPAVQANEAAINILGELAGADPDTYLPELAISQRRQSGYLSRAERPEDALGAVRQAVAIHRQLAADHPGRFLPALALSLRTLALCLSGLRRRHDALAAIEEAVDICRELAAGDRDRFLPELSTSLRILAGCLLDLGRLGDALAAIQEAVAVCRRPDAQDVAGSPSDLASSLTILAATLAALGRTEEAEAARAEVAAIESRE